MYKYGLQTYAHIMYNRHKILPLLLRPPLLGKQRHTLLFAADSNDAVASSYSIVTTR